MREFAFNLASLWETLQFILWKSTCGINLIPQSCKPSAFVVLTKPLSLVSSYAVFFLTVFWPVLHWPLSSFSIVACPLSHSLRMLMPAALCMDCCMWVDGHGGESFDSCWVWHDPSAAQAIYRHQRQDSQGCWAKSDCCSGFSRALRDARCPVLKHPLRMDGPYFCIGLDSLPRYWAGV